MIVYKHENINHEFKYTNITIEQVNVYIILLLLTTKKIEKNEKMQFLIRKLNRAMFFNRMNVDVKH